MTQVSHTRPRRRRGGRAAMRAVRTAHPIIHLPTLVRKIPVYEVLNQEGVELIHDASMRIVEEAGIAFRDEESLGLWREAGADIDDDVVRIPRELLMSLLAKAPSRFTLHARNPDLSVEIGGAHTVFTPGYGAPYVRGLDDVRRTGTLADFTNFAKLSYMLPAMHITGGVLCEPMDVPVPKRHLHMVSTLIRTSDKPFIGMVTQKDRAEDSIRLAQCVFGEDFLENHTVTMALCNGNSPRVWDQTMLDAVKTYARHNQAVLCTPFSLAGATTPADPVGTIAQLNAESLAAVALGQLVRAGSPMVFSAALWAVSMRSGAPVMGTPELSLMNFMSGQLARFYDLPFRTSSMWSGSKVVDAHSGYESATGLFATLLSGGHVLVHCAGLMESTLTMSYGKFLLDAEQVEMAYKLGAGPQLEGLPEAMAAVREVPPGGHYLGSEHTLKHFQTAFHMPALQDTSVYEQWEEEGSKDSDERARDQAKAMLERYEPPPLDPAIDEAITTFVAEREAVLPDEVR